MTLLSVKEARETLKIGETMVRNLIGAGELHAIKIGRRTLIKADSVDRLIQSASAHVPRRRLPASMTKAAA